MATNTNKHQILDPSEVTRMFSDMSPQRATSYYAKCMLNPDTPLENVEMLLQYRQQNPEKFLNDDQLRRRGSFLKGKHYSGGYYPRDENALYYNYDNGGYEASDRSYQDGGSRRFFTRRDYGSGSRYGGRSSRFASFLHRKPVNQERSPLEIEATMVGLRTNVRRSQYFDKVMRNPDSNAVTKAHLESYRVAHPDLFASADEVAAAKEVPKRSGWIPRSDFDKMSPRKKQFFVGAFRRKDRSKNTAYSLRVITDPDTKEEDRKAMTEVVRENPLFFFRTAKPQKNQNYGRKE